MRAGRGSGKWSRSGSSSPTAVERVAGTTTLRIPGGGGGSESRPRISSIGIPSGRWEDRTMFRPRFVTLSSSRRSRATSRSTNANGSFARFMRRDSRSPGASGPEPPSARERSVATRGRSDGKSWWTCSCSAGDQRSKRSSARSPPAARAAPTWRAASSIVRAGRETTSFGRKSLIVPRSSPTPLDRGDGPGEGGPPGRQPRPGFQSSGCGLRRS